MYFQNINNVQYRNRGTWGKIGEHGESNVLKRTYILINK